MRMRILVFIAAMFCIFALLSPQTASAFDGQKRGFVLGIGPGLGWARNDLSIATEKKFAVKTDFLIGWGLSNRTLLTWSSKVLWYDSAGVTTASGTAGLGLTYFLNEDENASFINAVVGFNQISAPFESNAGSFTGFGLGIGFGKEISRNWLVGVDASWGKPETGISTIGIGLHFSHLWY